MFYAASKAQIEQLHPELINYEPAKTRCFYYYDDGTVRWFDRINGYYFSDKPWGLEQEMMAEGIDQEFTEDYLSLNIRNSIKCPDGWSFWCLDYSAEELRLGAINTKGKAFMEAFTSGKDVHTLVGINTFGEEKFYSDKKKYRKIAKTLNFNMQYGGTPFGVARMLEVSQEEAQKIYDDYMLAMKDHFDVQDMQVAVTHQTGCEHTFFGLPIRLKRYYMNPNDRKNIAQGERLARNCRIQGCLNYETLVLTNKGYIQIGELYDNWDTYKDADIKVWTGDFWTRFYPSYMGKASKYKITFSNGQEFYCDNRHKIKVFTGNDIEWKCVTDYDNTVPILQIGDSVCFNIPKQFDFPITHTSIIGEKSTSDNPKYKEDIIFDREDILDMCYMYGSILGDGNIDPITKTIRHCWGYTKFDNIDRFTKLLNKYNIYFPIREKHKSDRKHITKDTEFCCAPLVNAMCKLFGITEYENVYTKKLHKEIYKFDLEMIRQILLGLYDTDGTKLTAELHLCNKELLLGVQKLLWITGYNSHIKKYKCENNAYMLIILGHKGKDYIHWLHTGEYINSYSSSTLAYHKNLFKEKLVKPYIYATESERASIFKLLNNKNVSLNMFRNLCKQNNILFEDYEYNTVIAIENCNEEIDTYELTVEDPQQQFIAEDIVNHNTGADVLSIAFMKLWKKIWEKLGNPEDYIRFQITVHDLRRNLVVSKSCEPMLKGCH